MLMAALIFVVSLIAFGQFFFFYARSVLAASRRHVLSDYVRDVAASLGMDPEAVRPEVFGKLLSLVELCPGSGEDELSIRAVRAYFAGLDWVRTLLAKLPTGAFARLAAWIEAERQACAYFAAVALDQRMAYSRALLAHQ